MSNATLSDADLADAAANMTSNMTESATNVTSASPWMLAAMNDTRFVCQNVLTPIVIILGVIGNLVSIIVLTRRRMRSSTNSYLTALAVSDTLYLVGSFALSLKHSVPDIDDIKHHLYWHYWPIGHWLVDAAANTSTWLTVTFTVERYIAVCHPIRGQVYCTESRARKVICIVYVICFLSILSTAFEWEVKEVIDPLTNKSKMTSNPNKHLGENDTYINVFYWFSAVTFTFIPLILLAIFNLFLILAVKESRRQRAVLCAGENQSQHQENKITIMLISVVVIYMVCQLPHAITLIYVSITGSPKNGTNEDYLMRILGNVFNLLVAINAAINFVLYCALSDKYRKTFLVTFCRCWYRPASGLPSALPTAYSNVSDFSRTGSPRSNSSKRSSLRSQRSVNGGTRCSVRGRGGSPADPPAAFLGVPGSKSSESQGLLDGSGKPLTAGGQRAGGRRRRLALPDWLRFGAGKRRHNIVVTTPDGSREQDVTAV